MGPRFGGATTLVPLLLLAALVSAAHAHNITAILERSPQFSQFNELLSKTGVARAINFQQSITVLAVPNDQIGSLAGEPLEVQQRTLKAHVILDYFDAFKLRKLPAEQKTQVTNMYQKSGTADGNQGFLDIVRHKDGSVSIFSAVLNAPTDIKLGESVAQFPYNISVLALSRTISIPGLDGKLVPIAAPAPKVRQSPPPAEDASTPAEGPEAESADAPTSAAPQPAGDAPSDAPVADAPEADSDNPTPPSPPPKSAAAAAAAVPLASAAVAVLASLIIA